MTDQLTEELTKAKGGLSKVTIGLLAAIALVLAFGGGILVQKTWGSTTTTTAAPAGQRFGNGTPPSGVQGGGRNGTVGTIDRVEGGTVYVKQQDGTVIKVTTSDSTQVTKTVEGALSDLKPGERIVIQGQKGSDGSVSAQRITQGATGPGGP
jgi:hypothetical protein